MADELAPPTTELPSPLGVEAPTSVALPLDKETYAQWKARVDRSVARQKLYHPWWEKADKAYGPTVDTPVDGYGEDISTKRIFTIVDRKSAELFYKQPDLNVAPTPLLEELDAQQPDAMMGTMVATAHGDLLNEKLGLDGVNVKRLAQRAVFDYLLYGLGWTVMGYRNYSQTISQPMVHPETGAQMLGPDGAFLTEDIPVPVKSECFWETLSPKQMLIPAEWTSIEFDKAPWLGHKFELTLLEAKRLWTLPENFNGSKSDHEQRMDRGDDADTNALSDVVTGTRIVYRSSVFREDQIHPDHLTELVLIDGLAEPVKHEDLALQKFDNQGQMTPDSLLGFPYHCLVIRAVTDAAYPMSDVVHVHPLERELNKGREQMIRQRDINLQRFTTKAPKDVIDKITISGQGSILCLPPDLNASDALKPMELGSFPPENMAFNQILDNDIERASHVSAMRLGTSAQGSQTATESSIQQGNADIALGWEQSFVADWFVSGATKFSSILQQFLSVEDAAKVIGTSRAQLWDTARKTIPARFAFTMEPDSSLRNDTPLHRKLFMEFYSFVARDPMMNRRYLDAKLAKLFHLDPTRVLLPTSQIPKPQPEPVMPTGSLKDLAILANPVVLAFIQANPHWGIRIPTEIMQAMVAQAQMGGGQPEHGGKALQVESLDKHSSEETGGQNGTGDMTPMMGGGMLPN